jgi:hypothetical protein
MGLSIGSGRAVVMLAFDLGRGIDLERARRRLAGSEAFPVTLARERLAPPGFAFRPPPLRVSVAATPPALTCGVMESKVEVTLYDFGAVSLAYSIPLQGELAGPIERVLALTVELYDHAALAAHARSLAGSLLAQLGDAVDAPLLAAPVEDYLVIQAGSFEVEGEGASLEERLRRGAGMLARVLRAERGMLSPEHAEDAVACMASYSPGDAVIVDWNAAIVLDPAPEDTLAVLEFANVELLEMRTLDDSLDAALERAEGLMRRRPGWWPAALDRDLAQLAALEMDASSLFEGVNHAMKLVGDQHLARVYRLAVRRFHLDAWDTSILRKLGAVEGIYRKLSDRAAARRMELLEWVIIVLIALGLILPLIGLM